MWDNYPFFFFLETNTHRHTHTHTREREMNSNIKAYHKLYSKVMVTFKEVWASYFNLGYVRLRVVCHPVLFNRLLYISDTKKIKLNQRIKNLTDKQEQYKEAL